MNKRSFKALLSVLLALVMVLGIAPMAVMAEEAGTKYTFADYEAGTQYAENEVHVLDEVVTVTTNHAHFTTQLRLYDNADHDGTAVIASTKVINSVVLNAGNKAATLKVYGSTNGSEWTLVQDITTTSAYADHTVTMPADSNYTYLKLDADGKQQIRVAYMVLTFAEGATPVEPVTATISFADKAQRTEFSTEKQVWAQNGITVTNNKGTSTNNVADYSDPARFYMNSELIIAFPGMMQIDVACNKASYATALVNSISDENATVTVNEKVVTIVLTEAVDTFTVAALSAQVRVDSITVSNTVTAGETPEVPKTEETETPADPTPDTVLTIEEAIALGASKEHNTYTAGKYYVVGEITEVYNTQFGNMRIKDANGTIFTVYGTYSADGETRYDSLETKPVAGDTVKVYGIIGQYSGTAQMKNGWIVEHTPGETAPETTETPADPTPDTVLTIEEAIALGTSKSHNTYTEGKYYVTGVITEVYNTQYGNMKITDAAGNILTIYGTYSADGETRYDALETKPVVGDTVKIYGIVGQYNSTAQIKNGWIAEHTPAAPETIEPETTPAPTGDVIAVVAVLAVIALAGALLISKKRSYQN